MNHDANSACTYYGWCSNLPYRTIFFPVPPAVEKMPLEELHIKKHIREKLERYHHCGSIGDLLSLSDEDILNIRHTGPEVLYEIREALFEICGNIIEDHGYFYDPDVQAFLSLLSEGRAPKKAVLDSRKWMAGKYAETSRNKER